MKTIDKIAQRIKGLPEESQREVLHFVEFLLSKSGEFEEGMDARSWNQFSLEQAMQDLDDDDLPDYHEADLKEKYSK